MIEIMIFIQLCYVVCLFSLQNASFGGSLLPPSGHD